MKTSRNLAVLINVFPNTDGVGDNSKKMSAFFCPADTVHLKAHEMRTVQLHFLPFNIGKLTSIVW